MTKHSQVAVDISAGAGVGVALMDWLPPVLSVVATTLACCWYLVMLGQFLHGVIAKHKAVALDTPQDPTDHAVGGTNGQRH